MTRSLTQASGSALPGPGDEEQARRQLERWRSVVAESMGAGDQAFGGIDPQALLTALFGNSPFLTELAFAEPDVIRGFLEIGPDMTFEAILAEQPPVRRRMAVMAHLRKARRRVALLAALADISGVWPLHKVTDALSRFADRAIGEALDLALSELADKGELAFGNADHPGENTDHPGATSGVIVLGMGKLGAFELNYSSDIDLIILFDPARFRPAGRESPMALAVRVARALVYLLEHKSKDGYVFRTDLRLRPHPPGQPLALSVEDAEIYYERFGQNWERAAMIKARVVAGDAEAGEAFLGHIRPFLWRKHLDYAAIRDIHAIKRQINRHRGHGEIRVLGHDLKVGRGGIREIEFFVQTQQLILGGRVPGLRLRGTIETLDRLVEERWLEAATAEDLKAAYGFLRTVEHRLQMVADKQTHQLPADVRGLARFATFMGYDQPEPFADELRRQLELVERHYAALFEDSLDLGADGALVFTGTEDDPETLKTLDRLGFARPPEVAKTVRGWHHGHIRATRTARARELLTELMPELLRALGEQAGPDAAFARLDHFMSSLPAGVQLFSLFRANPRLLALVADLMGTAPRLADYLSHHVSLFDAMLAPSFFEVPAAPAELEAEFARTLEQADDLQDALDAARRWTQAREFQVGMHILLGESDGEAASVTLTALAEIGIRGLLPFVENWLARQHGRIEGGSFAVLGLGKLGSKELTIGSDLDLIFVFDAKADARSDGEKPLAAAVYYARLGQRLVSALTAKTAEGSLYEIDTRLRPSGNLGPVACSIESFERYQMESAQTWEHQALTRCRVIAGPAALAGQIDEAVERALTKKRDPEKLAADVRSMRLRIFKEHGSDDPWNLKHARGGLVEAEFLAQYLQLRHVAEHPALLSTETTLVFERAAGHSMRSADSRLLIRAVQLYRRLQALLRLSLDNAFDPKSAPRGLIEALIRAAAIDPDIDRPGLDIEGLGAVLSDLQQEVADLFDRHCPPDPSDIAG
ncbi:MAG: bifunctional [glutamine synthetase] adenylyltransferase/[glutamine synthetase]-adenylyl-L-tyrosine phosphorylase [Alphaproteobacteria bacterium]|nr:bifunctional [glutamine synthetase] adenylyltransferase/[glutamine synthetase]-adenylyl-L-tyrosine phosphorylase [Alphaproteobacteria bacterium]